MGRLAPVVVLALAGLAACARSIPAPRVSPSSPLAQLRIGMSLREVKTLVGVIRSGSFDQVTVTAFIELMRKHLEREIHDVFTLVEDMIPVEQLVSMSNWDVEHLHEANAKRKPWAERWLG